MISYVLDGNVSRLLELTTKSVIAGQGLGIQLPLNRMYLFLAPLHIR